jgi:hypothetical protein
MLRTLVAVAVVGMVAAVASSAQLLTYHVAYDTSYVNDAGVGIESQKVTSVLGLTQEQMLDMLFRSGPSQAGYDPNWVHKIDFSASVTVETGQELATLGAGITMSPGVSLSSRYSIPWRPHNEVVDVDGEPAMLWNANDDIGPFNNDLYGIWCQVNQDVAVVAHPGLYQPVLMGSIYVHWDGQTMATISMAAAPSDPRAHGWAIWTGIILPNGRPDIAVVQGRWAGGELAFAPEPATMAMLLAGAVLGLGRRRR